MLRAYMLEVLLALLVLWVVCWGLVKLYFLVRSETDAETQASRQIKREAEEALDDLERVTKTQKDPK